MKLLILGVGNPMISDDGFGVAAVRELAKEPLPDGVEVVDGGTAGLALTDIIEEAEQVLILDSADMRKPPGTVVEFSPDEVRNMAAERPLSLHQSDLLGTLRLMEQLGACPPARIIAVQPANLQYGTELSEEVQAALPHVRRLVRDAIAELA